MTKISVFAAMLSTMTCACHTCASNQAELSPSGTDDMTAPFLAALETVRSGGTMSLTEGTYHFYAPSAALMNVFISNHDQNLPRRVQLPIRGVCNVTICAPATGAKFVFHGESTGIMVMDSHDVALKNISLDWAQSPIGEAQITAIDPNGGFALDWKVRAFDGEGSARMLWDAETKSIKPNTGDIFKPNQAQIGDFVSFRSWERPSPAICLYRAEGVSFDNVAIHSAHGMGLLAQRSKDISWHGGGVFPREGCICSTKADATHFSNCRGEIVVSDALFSGMMDDAINVHSTCLQIVDKLSANTIRCRYMHPQAIGFEVFEPGERLRFIHARTLENGAECTVANVVREDDSNIVLTLDEEGAKALQDHIAGDAVENADWQPSVVFSNNTVKNNRARAALFTTPGKVRVTDNIFDRVSGSAILLAGDAANWYESGACKDVEITGNVFKDCLTSGYQFCTAVIAIAPTVSDLAAQKTPYHSNIRVENNVFDCPGAKLYDAVSATNVVWRGNRE